MNITSKSRYALKIMMDLAQTEEAGHAQRSDIAKRQGIPPDYMDHILSRLREAGLIASIRGRGGGYRLDCDPASTSVWMIFSAVEDAIHPVQCLDSKTSCVVEDICSSKSAWDEIGKAISDSLSGILLGDLVAKLHNAEAEKLIGASAVHECRGPRKRSGGA